MYCVFKTRPQDKHANRSRKIIVGAHSTVTSDQPIKTSQIDTADIDDKAETKQHGTGVGKTVTCGIGTHDDDESNVAGTSRGLEITEDKDTKLGDGEKLSIARSPAVFSHAEKNIEKAESEDTKLETSTISIRQIA